MGYKEEFEDFLDKMQGLLDNAKKQGHINVRVEDEDERIRQELLSYIKSHPAAPEGHIGKDILSSWIAWLEKQGEQKPGTIDIDKMVAKYSQTKDGSFGLPINCQIRAYRQGINDALNLSLNIEKQGEQKPIKMWHDVSEVPDEMQELLVEWESPDAIWHDIAFYDAETKAFRHLKQPINNVTRWAYVSDILSQSVTKTSEQGWSDALERQGEQKPVPKFKIGDTMRTLQEAKDGFTDGMPVVVSIDEEYYHCTNELIAIKDQDKYEYPPINRRQKPVDKVEPKFKKD